MTDKELMPCPFCGGKIRLKELDEPQVYYECEGACGCDFNFYYERDMMNCRRITEPEKEEALKWINYLTKNAQAQVRDYPNNSEKLKEALIHYEVIRKLLLTRHTPAPSESIFALNQQNSANSQDQGTIPAPIDVEGLKREIGELLGDKWGGNILNRNQMAINFAIDHLHAQGHLQTPSPVTQEAAKMALRKLDQYATEAASGHHGVRPPLLHEDVETIRAVLQHHAAKGEGE